MNPRSVKERLEEYVLSHPKDSFNLESFVSVLGKEFRPQIEIAVKKARKRDGIFKPLLLKDSFKVGFFRLNPDYETLEQMRQKAEVLGKERIIQDDRDFSPTEDRLVPQEHFSLPPRRQHFKSIIERMSKNVAFSVADIDLLKEELPHLLEPSKEE